MNDLITIPKEIFDRANTDPILSGYLDINQKRKPIYYQEKIVGFFNPYQFKYKDVSYWRTGNIYVLPEYRNKGIASKTIKDFFSDKEYGLAHVAENNPPSLRAFLNSGFQVKGMLADKNLKGMNLYLLIKKPNFKSAFLNW